MADWLQILGDLVRFDTTSSKSNLELIDYVSARLRKAGVLVEILPAAGQQKANLWATAGGAGDGGLVLSAHSDVVPVEGQEWSTDPFGLHIEGGYAYGRGTADMKGFLAVAISLLESIGTRKLNRPLHLALTFDEEVGCLGVPQLLSWIERNGFSPSAAFVGEPTSMRVVNAHKGVTYCETAIRGEEAHSSLPNEGVSAVIIAARSITLLQDIQIECCRTTDERFLPGTTTISANMISGGTANNILARECRFTWDIRSINAKDSPSVRARFEERLHSEILEPLWTVFPEVSAVTRLLAEVPPLRPEESGQAESIALRLARSNEVAAMPFATEAGHFQAAGMSTVLIGPGSISQAHQANECVSLDELADCSAFLERLAAVCGPLQ